MDKLYVFSLPVAALLAGSAALYYFGIGLPAGERDTRSPLGIELAMARPTDAQEYCLGAARNIFDVHWAAACMKQGEGAECELPDDKAAVVNAWLRDAEQRCAAGGAP